MEMSESLSRMYDSMNEHYDARFHYTSQLKQYYGRRVMFFHLKSGLIDVVVSDSRCHDLGRARINETLFNARPEDNNKAVEWACKIANVSFK